MGLWKEEVNRISGPVNGPEVNRTSAGPGRVRVGMEGGEDEDAVHLVSASA